MRRSHITRSCGVHWKKCVNKKSERENEIHKLNVRFSNIVCLCVCACDSACFRIDRLFLLLSPSFFLFCVIYFSVFHARFSTNNSSYICNFWLSSSTTFRLFFMIITKSNHRSIICIITFSHWFIYSHRISHIVFGNPIVFVVITIVVVVVFFFCIHLFIHFVRF